MSQHLGQTLEELAKIYGWDDKLIQLMHALPRAVADRYIEQAWSYDKDGWRHMLPTLAASARVLCLDARFGNTAAAFAEAGASVTVIHPCPVTVRISAALPWLYLKGISTGDMSEALKVLVGEEARASRPMW